MLVVGCLCFFFQAEDGIRDLVRSRGLGDVYKRQAANGALGQQALGARAVCFGKRGQRAQRGRQHLIDARAHDLGAVSYTHLTLPTSDLV